MFSTLSANVAIDNLKLACGFDRAHLPGAPLVLQIEGCMLQGCSFSGGRLVATESNAATVMALPELFLAWVNKVYT